jgi:hypothetical protein
MNDDVSLQSISGTASPPSASRSAPDVASDRARVCESLRRVLLSSRNSDGGWAYASGRRSRIEPTCWALLALGRADAGRLDTGVLERWPMRDGWLTDVAGVPPNHAFNALAGLLLDQAVHTRKLADALAVRIVDAKGIAISQTDVMRQDNSLQAWSWLDGTFSWVEPTAWCLLFLKQRRARGADRQTNAGERIGVGERMLLDRVCRGGGWNYGNSNVFGQQLWPYVPTTAAALLSLQDRRGEAGVRDSVTRLREKAVSERSAVALALAVVCLRLFDAPVGAIEEALTAYAAVMLAEADVNFMGVAMALYALAEPMRPAVPFVLS